MTDSWEDCEIENIVIPVLHVPNKEQIKRLEERKKIEESEIALMKDFFDDNNSNNNTNSNTNINTNISNKEPSDNTKHKQKINKQKENELKQKEFSEKMRKKKESEKKHSDVFGEVIHDKYDEYDKY